MKENPEDVIFGKATQLQFEGISRPKMQLGADKNIQCLRRNSRKMRLRIAPSRSTARKIRMSVVSIF